MNNSVALWTRGQLDANLIRIELLLNEPCFKREAVFTSLTQSNFIRLIFLEEALLMQAQQAGNRIGFLDEVGTNGRIEDITSLITGMCRHLDEANPKINKASSDQQTIPSIRHFFGAGTGYFPDGLFFSCPYEDELTFFIGRNRIFFSRHLVRAFVEAKSYLRSAIPERLSGV